MAFQKSADTAGEVRRLLESLKKNFQCTICLDLLSQPVSTKCNHQFCRKCFDELLHNKKKSKNAKCPLCNSSVTKRSLHTNTNMVEMVSSVRRLCNAADDDCEVLGVAPIMSQRCKKKKDERNNKKKSLTFTSTEAQPVNVDKIKLKTPDVSSTRTKAPTVILDENEKIEMIQRKDIENENNYKDKGVNKAESNKTTVFSKTPVEVPGENVNITSPDGDNVLPEKQEKIKKKSIPPVVGSSEEVIQPSIQSEGSSEFTVLPRVHRNLLKQKNSNNSHTDRQLNIERKNKTTQEKHEATASSSSSNDVIVISGDRNKETIVASSQTQSVTQSEKTEDSEVKSLRKDDVLPSEHVSPSQENGYNMINPSFTEDIPLTPCSGDAKEKIELLWKSYESPNRDHAMFGNPSFSRSLSVNISHQKPQKKLVAFFPFRDVDIIEKTVPKMKDLPLTDVNTTKGQVEEKPLTDLISTKGQSEGKQLRVTLERKNEHTLSEKLDGVSYSEDGIIPPTPPVPKRMKSSVNVNSTVNKTSIIMSKIDENHVSVENPNVATASSQEIEIPTKQKSEVVVLADEVPDDLNFDCEPMEVYTNEKPEDVQKNIVADADDDVNDDDDEICEVMYLEGNEMIEKPVNEKEQNKGKSSLPGISQENIFSKQQSNSKRELKRKRESLDLIYPGSSLGGGDLTDDNNLFDQEDCFTRKSTNEKFQRVSSDENLKTGSSHGEVDEVEFGKKRQSNPKRLSQINLSTNTKSKGNLFSRQISHSKGESKRDRESMDLIYPGSSLGGGEDENNLFGQEERFAKKNENTRSQQQRLDEVEEVEVDKKRRNTNNNTTSKSKDSNKQQSSSKGVSRRDRESGDLIYPGSSLGGGDEDDNLFDQEECLTKKNASKKSQRPRLDEVEEMELSEKQQNYEKNLYRYNRTKSKDSLYHRQQSSSKGKSKKRRNSIDLIYPGSSLGGGDLADDHNLFERDECFTKRNANKKYQRFSNDDMKIGSSFGDMGVEPDSNNGRRTMVEPKEATLDSAYSFLGSSPDIEIEPKRPHPSANNLIHVDSSLNVGLEEFQEIVNTTTKSRTELRRKNIKANACIVTEPPENDELFKNHNDEAEDPLSNITDNGNGNLNVSKRKRKQRISDSSSSGEDVLNNKRNMKSPLRKKKMSDKPMIHYDPPHFNDSESSDDELPQLPFKTKTKDKESEVSRNTHQIGRPSEREISHITPGQRCQDKTYMHTQSPHQHVSNDTIEDWKSKLMSPINLDPPLPARKSPRKFSKESSSTNVSHRKSLTIGNVLSPHTPKAPFIPVSQSTILPNRESHLYEKPSDNEVQQVKKQLVERDKHQRNQNKESEGRTVTQGTGQSAQHKIIVPVIITTRISKKVMLQCRSVLSKLDGRYSNEFIPEATHLVVETNENNALSKAGYTFKYLMALVSGLWVVNYKWLFASYRANEFVDELAFEAKGDPEFKQENIPRKYRLCHEKVSKSFFDGYCLCLLGRFKNSQISKGQLIQLLRKTAAEVLYSPSEMECSSSQMKTLLIADGLFDLTKEEREVTRNNGSLVCHPDWVVESIINLKQVDNF